MTQSTLKAHAATAALIAALAATATPAMAQDAMTPASPATTAPVAPPVIRSATPSVAPPTIVRTVSITPSTSPDAVARVPVNPEAAAEADAEQAQKTAVAKTATRRSTPATTTARTAPAVRESALAAAPVAARVPEADIAPTAPPVLVQQVPAPSVQEAPAVTLDNVETAPAGRFNWWWVGLGAAAFIALGAMIALLRSRRPVDEAPVTVARERVAAPPKPVMPTQAVAEVAPTPVAPVVAPVIEPAMRSPEPAVRAPQPVRAPTPVAARSGAATIGRHEQMALAGPTEDNPFATLKQRLRRARFYDRQERLAAAEQTPPRGASPFERPAAKAVAAQTARRVEPARERGGRGLTWPGGFKPAFGES